MTGGRTCFLPICSQELIFHHDDSHPCTDADSIPSLREKEWVSAKLILLSWPDVFIDIEKSDWTNNLLSLYFESCLIVVVYS